MKKNKSKEKYNAKNRRKETKECEREKVNGQSTIRIREKKRWKKKVAKI